MPEPRLMRSDTDRIIAGVCGGLAVYLGVDAVFVRLALILLVFASGVGIPIYVILMLIMPSESSLHKPPKEVMQDNMSEMGDMLTDSVQRLRQHPNGPTIAAALLILLGLYFLLNNLGVLSGVGLGIIGPVILIGFGIFWLLRRQ